MFRTSAGLLCFIPFILAGAAVPLPRSDATPRAPGAAVMSCGDEMFELYLRWHKEAVDGTPTEVSIRRSDDGMASPGIEETVGANLGRSR